MAFVTRKKMKIKIKRTSIAEDGKTTSSLHLVRPVLAMPVASENWEGSQTTRRKMERTKKLDAKISAYSVFMSRYLKEHGNLQKNNSKKQQLMTEAAIRWRDVRDDVEQLKWYQDEVERIKGERKGINLPEARRKSLVKKKVAQMQKMCKHLKDVGFESAFLIGNGQELMIGGSSIGKAAITPEMEERFQNQLYQECTVKSWQDVSVNDWDILRRRVQDLFNKLYRKNKKLQGHRVPYTRFGQTFTVTGLPEGIDFKRPYMYAYGKKTLRQILQCDSICFEEVEPEALSVQEVEPEALSIPEVEPEALSISVKSWQDITVNDWDILRRRVQDQFNKQYRKNKKLQGHRVPYARFGKTFTVTGLPEGIDFKRPYAYGKKTLRQILQCESICFKEVEPEALSSPEVELEDLEDLSSPDDSYYVEDILGRRDGENGTEYLVHWMGYAKEEATWEPEENIPVELQQMAAFNR
ncbi:uncharacterized protein LOC135156166 [Lytechinus pictus]|uniref:uncharacterized protein LOC135156166 n=1 Tax=Lytechinus pictus TaxID=7653 RepID=UPI0030B9E8A7